MASRYSSEIWCWSNEAQLIAETTQCLHHKIQSVAIILVWPLRRRHLELQPILCRAGAVSTPTISLAPFSTTASKSKIAICIEATAISIHWDSIRALEFRYFLKCLDDLGQCHVTIAQRPTLIYCCNHIPCRRTFGALWKLLGISSGQKSMRRQTAFFGTSETK